MSICWLVNCSRHIKMFQYLHKFSLEYMARLDNFIALIEDVVKCWFNS